jgi:hypothetical protein
VESARASNARCSTARAAEPCMLRM